MAGHLLYLKRKYGVATTIDGITLITTAAQSFRANPTLAAGDVKISKDGGAFVNLASLPTVTPAGDSSVQVALSATETQAARIAVKFVDVAGAEWEASIIIIETFGNASAQFTGDFNNLDAAVSSRLASGNVTVGGYAAGQDPATLVLTAPANKLATNASGNPTVAGYAAGQDPATLVLTTPANKLVTDATGRVTVGTNSDKIGYDLSAAGVDAVHDEIVEGGLSLRQMMRLMLSALAGKSSGGGTASIAFRDNADSKPRITATTDANGNRTAITLDGA